MFKKRGKKAEGTMKYFLGFLIAIVIAAFLGIILYKLGVLDIFIQNVN